MEHTAGVRLEGIDKRFGQVTAVDGVSLEIAPGQFFSLLGPSGCGKSTLLRIIAGLETPDAGKVWIGDRDATGAPPQGRPTAMVFQNYALFPHMTVSENVGYGLRIRRIGGAERKRRVEQALTRVALDRLGDRPVVQLSGGQQQRVALARAIAIEPAVLLFDEPLSNLDLALRQQTRRELKEIQSALGTTSIYVTHDQDEALALSDKIAVMHDGRILQVGSPPSLYAAPESAFVAAFLGFNVIRDARTIEGLTGALPRAGDVLAVRPEHLRPTNSAGTSGLVVRPVSSQYLGSAMEWWLETEVERLRMWLEPSKAVGEQLFIRATTWRWVRS